MARGYRQVEPGSYLYRPGAAGREMEYRVECIIFDTGEPVKVRVREVQQGTVANPGSPQHPRVRFWSLDQIEADAVHPHPTYGVGFNRVTDAWGRTVRRASFDRMIRSHGKGNGNGEA